MTPHERLVRTSRQTQATVYLVAAVYVAIGLLLAGYSAMSGEVLVALVGLMIVSLAVASAVLLLTTLRLSERVSEMATRIESIDATLHRVEETSARSAAEALADAPRSVNLAAAGRGNASGLLSAVVDPRPFPRIAQNLNGSPGKDQPAPPPDAPPPPDEQGEFLRELRSAVEAAASSAPPNRDAMLEELSRRWDDALSQADARNCQALLSELAEKADADLVDQLSLGLTDWAAPSERCLRESFAEQVRHGDYAAALDIGERLAVAFPDSASAKDFEHLRPHLERRLAQADESAEGDTARAPHRQTLLLEVPVAVDSR